MNPVPDPNPRRWMLAAVLASVCLAVHGAPHTRELSVSLLVAGLAIGGPRELVRLVQRGLALRLALSGESSASRRTPESAARRA